MRSVLVDTLPSFQTLMKKIVFSKVFHCLTHPYFTLFLTHIYLHYFYSQLCFFLPSVDSVAFLALLASICQIQNGFSCTALNMIL